VFVRETYGDHIPPVTLSMGYDAVAMLDEAISIAGSNNMKKVASVLKQLQELSLSHGKIAMDRNGDLLLPVSLLSLGEKGWTPFTHSSSAALSRIAAHGAEQ
jgi:ABC-type branched-subunit amino acid transport system substrate-binding protein